MINKNKEYEEVESFIKTFKDHGTEGLAAFYGILQYAQYINKIDFEQAKYLLDNFVCYMLLPEEYD